MDECDLRLFAEILNFATLFYWLVFLFAWVYRFLTLPMAPCGRLHLAVAGSVLSRLVSKSLSVPALFVCHAHAGLLGLEYLAQNFTWAVIFTLGLVICRGYGITHWTVHSKTITTASAASAGMFVLATIPVAMNKTAYKSLVYGYYLVVYSVQLYFGVKTLLTLVRIEQHIKANFENAQRKPILNREQLMIVILIILFAVYIFELCFFLFTLVNLAMGGSIVMHLSAIRDIVLTLIEPFLNSVIYYQVRPKLEDYDLAYTVHSAAPFTFPPKEALDNMLVS